MKGVSGPAKGGNDALIERILSSETFAGKTVLKSLLKHLHEDAKGGRTSSEAELAATVFSRKDFVPGDDTIVRVSMHKLRKELQHYFLSEGLGETTVVIIPKGNYSLQFLAQSKGTTASIAHSKWFLAGFTIPLFALGFYFFILRPKADHPIFGEYLKGDLPVFITLGDPFFFRITNTENQKTLIARDIEINSIEELRSDTGSVFHERPYEATPLEYAYFSQNNLWPLTDLISFFVLSGIKPEISPLSQLSAQDVRKNNHIVIGNINALGAFKDVLGQSSIRIETNPRKIKIEANGRDSLSFDISERLSGYYLDYAFLVKLPGPDHNLITIIADFHASGNKGLSQIVLNPEEMQKLEETVIDSLGHFPEYLEMLVEVKSLDYVDFQTKVIYFKELGTSVK